MKNIFKIIYIIFLSYLITVNGNAVASTHKVLKIAILDCPTLRSNNSKERVSFENSYIEGIQVAVEAAKKKGYTIRYKTFFYGSNLLDIINKIPDLEKWNPDAIIGLHSSNQFFITRSYFNDIMVISLFATDKNIINMPGNFYSLGVADQYALSPIIKFIKKHFFNKKIFLAIEADSKESNDLGELFKHQIKKSHPSIFIAENKFLRDEVESLDVDDFIKPYKKGSLIIIMADDYYKSAELMGKIAKYLSPYVPDFITTVDNWGDEKPQTENNYFYKGYRITNYIIKPHTESYRDFYSLFVETNHKLPENFVSYATYQGVMSIIEALQKYPINQVSSMKKKIIDSYQKAVKNNPMWFKSDRAYVYEITPGKETLLNESYQLGKK